MAELLLKAPPHCPYCQSAKVMTSAKPVTSSYWRCETCGQIWHPDRTQLHRAERGLRRG